MKNLLLAIAITFGIGLTTFAQSKPGEGWYDSGDGQANAPGSSKDRDKNGPNDVDKDERQDRQQTVVVEVSSESGNSDTAINAAKDKLIAMGAKAITVYAVTKVVGQAPGFVFKIALGVMFPATKVADGERQGGGGGSQGASPSPKKSMGHAEGEAPDHEAPSRKN